MLWPSTLRDDEIVYQVLIVLQRDRGQNIIHAPVEVYKDGNIKYRRSRMFGLNKQHSWFCLPPSKRRDRVRTAYSFPVCF